MNRPAGLAARVRYPPNRLAHPWIVCAALISAIGVVEGASLCGLVHDAKHTPVTEAIVELRQTAGGHPVRRTSTDDGGHFCIYDLAVAKYRLLVIARGFAETLQDVDVGDRDHNTIGVVLPGEGHTEHVTVTATRSLESQAAIPGAVTVLGADQIANQATPGESIGDFLGKVVPGLTPGTQSLSIDGQTLRGRNILVLIDGIPQATLRNVYGDLWTIDLSAVDRIEVLRSATTIFGSGATGGVINVVTRRASTDFTQATSQVGTDTSLTHGADSVTRIVRQSISGRLAFLDYSFAGALLETGGSFDANGNRIPPDPHGQGGVADTRSRNILFGVGVDIPSGRRIQLSFNRYTSEQDTQFTYDPQVNTLPAGSTPSRALRGLAIQDSEGTTNTLVNFQFMDPDAFGSSVSCQLYYRDYWIRFFPFDGREFPIFGRHVFQPSLGSRKLGARVELNTPLGSKGGTVLWGLDYSRESTNQVAGIIDPNAYDHSGGLVFKKIDERVWVPLIKLDDLGLFGQLNLSLGPRWRMRGGLRHEVVSVSVDDFTTIADSPVIGGELAYRDTLGSLGAVFSAHESLDLFANVEQGFAVPDLGRVLRGAPAGASVNALPFAAQEVTAYEIGVRRRRESLGGSVSVFYTTSELGTSSGGFNEPVLRAPERIHGIELTINARLQSTWRSGGTFSWMKGKSDPDQDGSYEYLNGFRISPPKITAYVERGAGTRWWNRLQMLYSGDRERFPASMDFGEREVESYVVLDWRSRIDLGRGALYLGVDNLLNSEYFPVKSQLIRTGRNDSYALARGTSLSLMYKVTYGMREN